ncbi:radical SAM protein [Candidatus Pacearchaeota archaeon]|nr:radical SAM protein [Candidatus Pacearchaeota archaeon]
MHYHIILTEKCNLQCRYCYEKSMDEFDNGLEEKFSFDFNEPCVSQIKIEKLKSFIEKDKDAVTIFYGGEPLLQIDKIKTIMNEIDVPFRMQTNGILLNSLEPKYLNRIDKILISLDGDKERTDYNRGKGTYEKVIKNIELIKNNGYEGELIARMAIAQEFPDLYEQVIHLINLKTKSVKEERNNLSPLPTTNYPLIEDKIFDSVHWQLDVGFYKEDFEIEKIKKFFDEYNKSISKLLEYWVKEIEQGNVLMLYPFVGIVESILKNEPTKIRCGAGHSGYAISTSGKVVACPIMNSIEDFKTGTLDINPSELKKIDMNECENCEIVDLCGGRCMYWRKAGLWPKEGDDLICDSIKYYIKEIQKIMPRINEAIEKEVIKESDFDYEKYFGPEIIP